MLLERLGYCRIVLLQQPNCAVLLTLIAQKRTPLLRRRNNDFVLSPVPIISLEIKSTVEPQITNKYPLKPVLLLFCLLDQLSSFLSWKFQNLNRVNHGTMFLAAEWV